MAQVTTLYLLTGDYPDRLQRLWDAATAAENDTTPLLEGEEHPYDILRAEHEGLKSEAEANGIKVTLQAVGRKGWRELRAKHPARTEGDPDTVKGDRIAQVNRETVEDDLVYASVCFPEFTSRSAYDEWADALSEGEFQTILGKAWSLANVAQFDPKSLPELRTHSSGKNTP